MFRSPLRSSTAKLAVAALFAAGMTAAPLSFSDDLGLDSAAAYAKGGNGGGNGGGNDKGGRGGNDKGGRDGNAKSGGNGKGGNSASAGKSSPGTSDAETDEVEVDKAEKSKKGGFGSLNASNASATARANASPNSRVGAIAEYENAMAAGDPDAAAAALARAANKEITPEAVAHVNANIGVEATPEEEAEMADLAEAARTATGTEEDPEGEETTAAGEEGGETTEEDLDEIAQAVENLMDGVEEGQTSTQ